VRVPKLIGTARMIDMMLTSCVYDAQEGERLGSADKAAQSSLTK